MHAVFGDKLERRAIRHRICIVTVCLQEDAPHHWRRGRERRAGEQLPTLSPVGKCHRRTSQGAGEGCNPPDSGKTIIFRAKAKFFGQKPGAKNEKKHAFAFIKRKKTGLILSSEIKCPNPGCLLLITGVWGESDKVILQVSIAVFFGRCRKISRAKMAQPP